MKKYIYLRGCDDTTKFEMDLNESQIELLKQIEDKSKEVSECPCMPVFKVRDEDIDYCEYND